MPYSLLHLIVNQKISAILFSQNIWTVIYNANSRPVRFTSQDEQKLVECNYDYMGRRFLKKSTINGVLSQQHHYLYRGYLQIAALDMKTAQVPALWYIHWDPTEPIATRPLSIRRNATWYTYSQDLTKNVTELYSPDGTIDSSYDYSPYGAVTVTGSEQPIQWSSEVYDPELALSYYNYRHYNPTDGRWLTRDPIGEQDDLNLYGFVGNNPLLWFDYLGNQAPGFEGAVCARQLREIKEKYLEPVGPVTPIQAGVSMANGSASQNNLFKKVAKAGVGKKDSVKETITGKELLEYFQQLSENSCCIQKLTIAGHGWSSGTPKDIVARPDGPGLPGKDNGTGFYKDESGQASTNLAREMKDLKREIIRKRVRFCSPCEIMIHACNISSEFAESFAATTGCKITYAKGSCSTVDDNVRKWSSGCGAEQGSENDASNGFWQTDGGKASISKGRYFTQR